MTLTLQQYCEKHNYKIVQEYFTLGEERGNHKRAIVEDVDTGERFYLYYDRSRRKRTFVQQKRDLLVYVSGGVPELPSERGWRNTTLENRRSRQVRHDKKVSRPSQ